MAMFLLLGLICSIAGAAYVFAFVGRREKHLPPGPPTLPVLGNIHQIPKKGAHFQFTQWAQQYGGLYTLKLGTGTAAVITDRRLVKQLIDKKSALYSERPESYVANLISSGDHILLMKYGQQWRSTRKLLHGSVMEKMVDEQHLPLQEAEARQMVRDYLLKPEDHMLHPKRFSNSVTMSIVWGVRTPTPQTEHMQRYLAASSDDILEDRALAYTSPSACIASWRFGPRSWRQALRLQLVSSKGIVIDDVGDVLLTGSVHPDQTFTQSCTAYPRRFSSTGETAPLMSSAR
jgi:cytochrome P450